MSDRLTRDAEALYKGDQPGAIDEIVLSNADVHLERMSRKNWMLIVKTADVHFHLNVRTVTEYEMLTGGRQLGPRDEWPS